MGTAHSQVEFTVTVFNVMENNTAFDTPKNFHYRDSSKYLQGDDE